MKAHVTCTNGLFVKSFEPSDWFPSSRKRQSFYWKKNISCKTFHKKTFSENPI